MIRTTTSLLGLAALGIAAAAVPALAEYPEKPIRVIVPTQAAAAWIRPPGSCSGTSRSRAG